MYYTHVICKWSGSDWSKRDLIDSCRLADQMRGKNLLWIGFWLWNCSLTDWIWTWNWTSRFDNSSATLVSHQYNSKTPYVTGGIVADIFIGRLPQYLGGGKVQREARCLQWLVRIGDPGKTEIDNLQFCILCLIRKEKVLVCEEKNQLGAEISDDGCTMFEHISNPENNQNFDIFNAIIVLNLGIWC